MIIFDKIKSLFTQNKIPAEQQTTYSEQVENNLMIRLELAQKTIALEKSLDRVRVCALKMNTTDELATVVETLLVELEGLNLGLLRVGIAILNKNLRTTKTWSSFLSDEKRRVKLSGEYSVDIHKVLANAFDKWAKGLDDVYFYTIEPDELKAYYAALNKVNFNLSSQNQTAEETAIKRQYYVGIYFKEGGLFAFSNKPYENYTIELLKRFTEVIGLTYARFNEIKVAENSAKKVTTLLTEIRDSINYAKRIQQTLLAQDDFLRDNLNELFVFFVPKDIVSGDFYWATKQNKKFYLAVCDSTGHGVPGAFMSLLNIGFLNEAINEKAIEKPNEVFDYVRLKLINTISKDDQKDGFDGILLCFDEENKSITYAAANNSPLLIRDGVISAQIENQYNNMPVGAGDRKASFTLFSMDAKPGDIIYLCTDGYADQFGGAKGKKLKQKKLNEFLVSINAIPVSLQSAQLNNYFESWKGDLEQVDDICVIGIRV